MACFVCCFDNDDGEYIEAHCDGDYTEYGEGEKYFASRVTTVRTWTHTMWKPGLPWKRSSTRGSPSPSDCQTSTSEADDDLINIIIFLVYDDSDESLSCVFSNFH